MKERMSDSPPLLIVDDEASPRDLLVRVLSGSGYASRQSGNATEALEMVHREPPSLALIDFKMPGVDGVEMLKRLRSDPDPMIAQIPVIMMTGHGENEVLCLEAGADDFVTKPINIAVLRARIATQLRLGSMRAQLQKRTEETDAR